MHQRDTENLRRYCDIIEILEFYANKKVPFGKHIRQFCRAKHCIVSTQSQVSEVVLNILKAQNKISRHNLKHYDI